MATPDASRFRRRCDAQVGPTSRRPRRSESAVELELYLSHDVGAALRDELRFRFEGFRRQHPDTRHGWTGSFSGR